MFFEVYYNFKYLLLNFNNIFYKCVILLHFNIVFYKLLNIFYC